MKKVIDKGIYCGKCNLFIRDIDVMDWECPCSAEAWENVKILMVSEEENK